LSFDELRFSGMMVMPITILFIDFATGLCENPRQKAI